MSYNMAGATSIPMLFMTSMSLDFEITPSFAIVLSADRILFLYLETS